VANALAGVQAGAVQVQGTINGLRRAHRQLQPDLGHRHLQLKMDLKPCR
jgi:hypothetical protein